MHVGSHGFPKDFLTSQGLRVAGCLDVANPNAISASGSRITGLGCVLPFGTPYSWILDIPNVRMCPASGSSVLTMRTILVPFADSIEVHLAHGDTLGDCGN